MLTTSEECALYSIWLSILICLRIQKLPVMTHFLESEEKCVIWKEEINKTETKFKQIYFNRITLKINTDMLNY